MADSGQLLRFGTFALDSRNRELHSNGSRIRLQEQPFQILSALVEKRGKVVSREELRKRLWSDDAEVDFNNRLNVAIARLRQILDDRTESPPYIETLPRAGYRLVVPVEVQPVGGGGNSAPSRERVSIWTVSLSSAAVTACIAFLTIFSRSITVRSMAVQQRPSVAILGFRNLTAKPGENGLSIALSELLAAEIAAGEQFRIIPGESAERARLELGLPDSERYSPPALTEIRLRLGADYVLAGSYIKDAADPRRIHLDLLLLDTKTGHAAVLEPLTRGEDDLAGLAAQAAAVVRQRLPLVSTKQSGIEAARFGLR